MKDKKRLTNYERIRNMNIDEMADFLNSISDIYDDGGFYSKTIDNTRIIDCCNSDIREWLESEVMHDEED